MGFIGLKHYKNKVLEAERKNELSEEAGMIEPRFVCRSTRCGVSVRHKCNLVAHTMNLNKWSRLQKMLEQYSIVHGNLYFP